MASCLSWASISPNHRSHAGFGACRERQIRPQGWLTFLRNHREAIAAMDFFTVPTLTLGVLYCFFVIGHERRKILRFNVTRNPSALWIVQPMREAWPYASMHNFLLFDRDSKFGGEVVSAVRELGSAPG